MKSLITLTLALCLFGCGEVVSRNDNQRILTMGDSLLAWNGHSGNTISDVIEGELNEPVVDRSMIGAQHIYRNQIIGNAGMKIASQYRYGNWDWIVLNGGGNDLWLGCGCTYCDDRIDLLIGKSGQRGEIPNLVSKLRSTGAHVVYVGYLHSPGSRSIVDHCKGNIVEFESRIAKLADQDDGIHFVQLADLVPKGDLSFHDMDRIHPSVKASKIIGRKIATVIQSENR